MESWGSGNLQNDVASDWAYQFFEPGNHAPLVEAALAAGNGAPAGAPIGEAAGATALAAGEVVAAWLRRPGSDVNDTVTVWARAQKAPPASALVAAAAAAATRVRDGSALRDRWAAGEGLDAWLAVVDGLLARLAG